MESPAALLHKLPILGDAQDDGLNAQRIEYVRNAWRGQDEALRQRDRQVELNIRMLAGQQWSVWNKITGRYQDVTDFMTPEEREWRKRPVINRLLPWFIVTHSRLTENQPIATFVPGPDRADAELAEALDILFKAKWRELAMPSVNDLLQAWLIATGRSYLMSSIDPNGGPVREWRAGGTVDVVDEYGTVVGQQELPDGVGYDAQGNVVTVLNAATGQPEDRGQVHSAPRGEIDPIVLSCLEVRGAWNSQPWHKKDWHMVRQYLTPEQVFDEFGLELQADTHAGDLGDGDSGVAQRVLFGGGFFGASVGWQTSQMSHAYGAAQPLCTIYRLWYKAGSQYPKREGVAGGRMLVCSPTVLLRDTAPPVTYPHTSPVHAFGFVALPGRPHDTSPLEAMIGLQLSYNRVAAQELEHTALLSNPKPILDAGAGLDAAVWSNKPGEGVAVWRRPGVPAVEWLVPPPLNADHWRVKAGIREEMDDIGGLKGTEGIPFSPDASGEALKELRFNSDRLLGATSRRNVEEYGRVLETWIALAKVLYDLPEVVRYVGDDNVARSITVFPEMFDGGKVNVVPDVESMLPEGRGERQQRIYQMYRDGMFGQPGTPEATNRFFELGRFPHLSRTARPGGVDRVMAEQFLGALLRGTPAEQIPLHPWYDLPIHLDTLAGFMKSPEYLKMPPDIQQALADRWSQLMGVLQQQQQDALDAQLALQEQQRAAEVKQAHELAEAKQSGKDMERDTEQQSARPRTADQSPPRGIERGAYPTAGGAGPARVA